MTLSFFSRASLETLKLILLVFGRLPRLRINLNKRTLFYININQDQISKMALMLDCSVSDWPLTYFGLPLGGESKIKFILGFSD